MVETYGDRIVLSNDCLRAVISGGGIKDRLLVLTIGGIPQFEVFAVAFLEPLRQLV
jgi:hypothetical protein